MLYMEAGRQEKRETKMQDRQYGSKCRLLCIATALALFASGGLTQSVSAFQGNGNGNGNQIVLTGFARDFLGLAPGL